MKHIALFGSIGVGKTTIGIELEKKYKDIAFVRENLENNIYLPLFYNDMKKYAFKSTIEMLTLMVSNQMKHIDKEYIIYDNGIEEMICYNRYLSKEGYLDQNEFIVYQNLYNTFLKLLPKIDIYIYAYCDVKEQLNRILKRGRPYEKTINEEFLIKLNGEYEKYIKTLPKDKLLIINTNKKIDLEYLYNYIKMYVNKN